VGWVCEVVESVWKRQGRVWMGGGGGCEAGVCGCLYEALCGIVKNLCNEGHVTDGGDPDSMVTRRRAQWSVCAGGGFENAAGATCPRVRVGYGSDEGLVCLFKDQVPEGRRWYQKDRGRKIGHARTRCRGYARESESGRVGGVDPSERAWARARSATAEWGGEYPGRTNERRGRALSCGVRRDRRMRAGVETTTNEMSSGGKWGDVGVDRGVGLWSAFRADE